jgi:hypothetical protein
VPWLPARVTPRAAGLAVAATLATAAWLTLPAARPIPGQPSADRVAPLAQAITTLAVASDPNLAQPPPSPAVAADTGRAQVQAATDQPDDGPLSEPPADGQRQAGDVMFLTIVGEQTFVHWGRAGDRPPRIDATGVVFSAGGRLAEADGTMADAAPPSPEIITPYGGEVRPYGPEPQACPRTLPAGSDQATANGLRTQFGCRYLSSCTADDDCTWYYQGRD